MNLLHPWAQAQTSILVNWMLMSLSSFCVQEYFSSRQNYDMLLGQNCSSKSSIAPYTYQDPYWRRNILVVQPRSFQEKEIHEYQRFSINNILNISFLTLSSSWRILVWSSWTVDSTHNFTLGAKCPGLESFVVHGAELWPKLGFDMIHRMMAVIPRRSL